MANAFFFLFSMILSYSIASKTYTNYWPSVSLLFNHFC